MARLTLEEQRANVADMKERHRRDMALTFSPGERMWGVFFILIYIAVMLFV